MEINLSNYIKQPCEAAYLHEHQVLYHQLLFLNTSVFYLERLSNFPSRILISPTERVLWNNTIRVYVEQIMLIIGRIAIDSGNTQDINRDVISFPRFKQRMNSEYLHLPLTREVSIGFDEFDARLSQQVIEPFRTIRNKYIAHLDYQLHMPSNTQGIPQTPPQVQVDLKQINHIKDALISIFDTLSFNQHYSLWYWDLSENRRNDRTTDIDLVLDGVAKEHYLIKQPPPDMVEWFGIPEELSDRDLDVINEYRARFGLEKLHRKQQPSQ